MQTCAAFLQIKYCDKFQLRNDSLSLSLSLICKLNKSSITIESWKRRVLEFQTASTAHQQNLERKLV